MPDFDRPIFILSAPRSGSTLLFQTLAQAADAGTIGSESHALIETIAGLHPSDRGWSSNALDVADATFEVVAELDRRFRVALRDRNGQAASGAMRLIEKTPKNCLRVPFLQAAYPDARFVYLYRDPRATISSMIEAWLSGGFRTYPRLPGWRGTPWSLLLVPGWRSLIDRPLFEIVARQWASTMTALLDGLEAVPREQVVGVAYEEVIAAPNQRTAALARSLDLVWDLQLPAVLPLSPTVVSAPAPDKWRRHERELAAIWSVIEAVDERARDALTQFSRSAWP